MPEINDNIFSREQAVTDDTEQYRRKVQWFSITWSSIGLFLIFGGMGMSISFHQDAALSPAYW